MNYLELFSLLEPEIAITGLIFLILAIDLFGLKNKTVLFRFQLLGLLTGIGLAVIMLRTAMIQLPPAAARNLLGGMLVLDPLTVLFKILLITFALITVIICMNEEFTTHVSEFYALLLFALLGMIFMVMSEELIMIFVALELTSLSLYILTAFAKRHLYSAEAAMKYFLFGTLSSAFMYFGLGYIYGIAGVTNLKGLGDYLSALPKLMISTDHILVIVGLLFTMMGMGFKIAVVPFHLWAPDAYEGAPTPVTGFIATGSKAASFLILAKILLSGFLKMEGSSLQHAWEAGWSPLLATLSIASMTLGNLAAMQQKNIKRLLAYSSIAHSGYILFGLIAASHVGTVAMFFYIIVYAFTNLGAFGFVSVVARHTGGENLEDFRGFADRAPLLSLLMSIYILSLASIPPLGGFFGKFYLFLAVVGRDTDRYGLLWLVAIGIINTMLSLYYYLKILKQMYIVKSPNPTRIQSPFYLNAALSLCALIVLLTGIFPAPLIGILSRSVPFFSV